MRHMTPVSVRSGATRRIGMSFQIYVGIDLALHVLHDEVRGEACRVFSELKKLFAEKLFHAGGDAFVGRVMG